MIAFGAGIKAKGEVSNSTPIYANQLAITIAHILGIEYGSAQGLGSVIQQIVE